MSAPKRRQNPVLWPKRDRVLPPVRMTEAELAEAKQTAKAYHCDSLSAFVRYLLVKAKRWTTGSRN